MKKVHRFFAPLAATDSFTIQDRDLVKRLADILKLRAGERVTFFDGSGNEIDAELLTFSKHEIEALVVDRRKNTRAPQRRVVLYLSILKGEHVELVVEKCTELGVTEIVPIITHRTIKTNVNLKRLRAIAIESSEQSGRGTIPLIHEPISFADALTHAQTCEQRVLFHVATDLKPFLPSRSSIALFIGPEGGFDEDEVTLAMSHDVQLATLSATVLRGETAAIVACERACWI